MIGKISDGFGAAISKASQAFCRNSYTSCLEKIGIVTMIMPPLRLKALFRGRGSLDLLFKGNMKFGMMGSLWCSCFLEFESCGKSLSALGENIVD